MDIVNITSDGSDIVLHLESEQGFLYTMLAQSLDLEVSKDIAHRAIEELGLRVLNWGVMSEEEE